MQILLLLAVRRPLQSQPQPQLLEQLRQRRQQQQQRWQGHPLPVPRKPLRRQPLNGQLSNGFLVSPLHPPSLRVALKV